jgi:putative FmdB family regulatory protein
MVGSPGHSYLGSLTGGGLAPPVVAWRGPRWHHSAAVPTYDYQCRSCGTVTEVIHSMQEDGPSVCELCGGVLRRVLYPTGIIFKGSGFYSTDSRSGSSSTLSGSSGTSGSPAKSDPSGNGPSSKPSTDPAPAPSGDQGS